MTTLTNEELAAMCERALKHDHHIDRLGKGTRKEAAEIARALLAHLRASQTPAQAVTREQIVDVIDKTAVIYDGPFDGVVIDNTDEVADAILALLAEKPVPTPTPLTRRDDLHNVIARAMKQPVYNSSEICDAVEQYLERLSASPAPTPTPLTLDPHDKLTKLLGEEVGWQNEPS
jgi:hypothetical protein